MSKTSEFSKHVFEIQFHFQNAKRFGHGLVGIIGKNCFWSGPKRFGISKIKLDFPNIDWNFKSLGHKFLNELESFTTCGTIRSKSIRLRNWKRIRYSLRWLLHFNAQEPLTTIAHGWARVTDCMWRKEIRLSIPLGLSKMSYMSNILALQPLGLKKKSRFFLLG